ncbi:hypothetical protein [Nocardia wallacei]|uniref:hypothetical protein n=1 Tax=Nocardia wallacei TaxID=480035 RepID=UPI002454169C|nr:hypothetical protein [Nocardia wallacei]
MAREFARIRLSRNNDDDWCDLSPGAQHLYDILLTSDDLSYCGRVDWRPARLLPRARGWTLNQIIADAAELERARFVLFDPDTEEALVRSLIRSDELLRNPTLGVAVAKAYGALASRTLRAGVVTELVRVHEEHPEYSSWSHAMCAQQLARLLLLPSLDSVGYTNRITNPDPVSGAAEDPASAQVITNEITNRITNDIGNRNSNPGPVPNTNPDQSETPTSTPVPNSQVIGNPDRSEIYPHTADLRPQTPGGYVTGVRHQDESADSNDPPPKFHPEHPDAYEPGCSDCERAGQRYERHIAGALSGTEPPRHCQRHPDGTTAPCRECRQAREFNDQWHRDRRHAEALRRSEAAQRRADTRAQAIRACPLGCADRDGYTPDGDLCAHEPPPDRPSLREQYQANQAAKAIKACELCSDDGELPDGTTCDHQTTDTTTEENRAHA